MENKTTKSMLKSNMWRLVILTVAGSIIYGLPYVKNYYYDAYLATYHLTNTQVGTFGSAFGLLGMISYLFGGVLADRISARKLLAFSLVVTGFSGFLHLVSSNYYVLLAIYGLWGVTTLLTFWPALLKAVRMLASPSEQGRAFGLMEGGRGAVNAVYLAAAVAIFGFLSKKMGDAAGISGVIVTYSVASILLGIAVWFLFQDNAQEVNGSFQFKDILKVLKMPAVWLMTLILCASYSMNMSYFYFTPYATQILGAAATTGAVLTVMAQYVRPFASAGAGFLADRAGGSSRIMLVGFILMAGATAGVVLVGQSISVVLLVALCAVIYIAMYMNYGLMFSLMEEGGIPLSLSGTAIGVISALGYLPEVFCPLIAGKVLDAYPGDAGYHLYFTGVAVMSAIGFAVTLIWGRYVKRKKLRKQDQTEIAQGAAAGQTA